MAATTTLDPGKPTTTQPATGRDTTVTAASVAAVATRTDDQTPEERRAAALRAAEEHQTIGVDGRPLGLDGKPLPPEEDGLSAEALLALMEGGGRHDEDSSGPSGTGRIRLPHSGSRPRQQGKPQPGESDEASGGNTEGHEGVTEETNLHEEPHGRGRVLKGMAGLTAARVIGSDATDGAMTYVEDRVQGQSQSTALGHAGSSAAGNTVNALGNAAVQLIPFVTSYHEGHLCYDAIQKGDWGSAALHGGMSIVWGVVDAVGIVSLIIPGGGEAVEGLIATAKVAKGVEVAADATKGVEVAADAARGAEAVSDAGKVVKGADLGTQTLSALHSTARVIDLAGKVYLGAQVISTAIDAIRFLASDKGQILVEAAREEFFEGGVNKKSMAAYAKVHPGLPSFFMDALAQRVNETAPSVASAPPPAVATRGSPPLRGVSGLTPPIQEAAVTTQPATVVGGRRNADNPGLRNGTPGLDA